MSGQRAFESKGRAGNSFVAARRQWKRYEDGSTGPEWELIATPRPGFAYRYAWHSKTELGVEVVAATPFMLAVEVEEGDYQNWKERKSFISSKLMARDAWLLEVVRSTRDSITCNVLTSSATWEWDQRHPDVLIGNYAWMYRSSWIRAEAELKRGRRAFFTLDGNTLWEVEEVWPAPARDQPIRVVLVRRTSFPVLGIDSVLAKDGLDFIKDEAKRSEHENTIRRIEAAVAESDPHSIRECSQVVEALLFQLGKQRIAAGLTFGPSEDMASLQKAHLEPLLRGFTAAFDGTKLIKDELKWIPGAILAIRAWGEESRHEGKDDRQLLEADGMTGVFTYAALRDFVRLCQHLHKLDPKLLNPPAKARQSD